MKIYKVGDEVLLEELGDVVEDFTYLADVDHWLGPATLSCEYNNVDIPSGVLWKVIGVMQRNKDGVGVLWLRLGPENTAGTIYCAAETVRGRSIYSKEMQNDRN